MEVIWVKREQRYFCGGGWTGKSLFSSWRDFAVIDVILLKFSQGVVSQPPLGACRPDEAKVIGGE